MKNAALKFTVEVQSQKYLSPYEKQKKFSKNNAPKNQTRIFQIILLRLLMAGNSVAFTWFLRMVNEGNHINYIYLKVQG